MLIQLKNYSRLSDMDLVESLMAIPPIEEVHEYFFNVKCATFLKYISVIIFGGECHKILLGEFYEFLSKDNWKVLRQFNSRNGASLNSYLARCTINYFLAQKKKENKIHTDSIEQIDVIEELNHFTQEEENNMPPVWQAFEKLNERDRTILRLLVIEGKSALEAADDIWGFVKTKNKIWRELPPKRVQDTIAILKRRALLSLSLELKRMYK